MDSLSAAAQDVITRGMPLAKAARLNGVPRTTLRWRMAAMERELAGQRGGGVGGMAWTDARIDWKVGTRSSAISKKRAKP